MKLLASFLAILALSFSSEWNYNQNGADWTGTCSTGQKQSPIDIPKQPDCDTAKIADVTWNNQAYTNVAKTTPGNTNGAHNIQMDVKTSTLKLDTKTFNALQFHIHAPSEHTVNGKSYDAEVHFVHQLSGGTELAVVGLFFDKDAAAPSATSKYFFDESRVDSTDFDGEQDSFNPKTALKDILDKHDDFYFYSGSLTTPPCTEGVNWVVLKDPLPITQAQLDKITHYFADNNSFAGGKGNNRKVQALNGRKVKMGGDGCDGEGNSTFGNILYISQALLALLLLSLI